MKSMLIYQINNLKICQKTFLDFGKMAFYEKVYGITLIRSFSLTDIFIIKPNKKLG